MFMIKRLLNCRYFSLKYDANRARGRRTTARARAGRRFWLNGLTWPTGTKPLSSVLKKTTKACRSLTSIMPSCIAFSPDGMYTCTPSQAVIIDGVLEKQRRRIRPLRAALTKCSVLNFATYWKLCIGRPFDTFVVKNVELVSKLNPCLVQEKTASSLCLYFIRCTDTLRQRRIFMFNIINNAFHS